MEANACDICTVFPHNRDRQYIIPLFQRRYVWNKEGQWLPLWEDILRRAKMHENGGCPQKPLSHFTGAIVVQQQTQNLTNTNTFEIIDGQQRLTTFQLILCAIRDIACNHDNDEAFKKIREDAEACMFNNEGGDGDNKLRLIPTEHDISAFQEVMDGHIPTNKSHNIVRAHLYFKKNLEEKAKDDAVKLRLFFEAVTKGFNLVSIIIDRDDNPEAIFESLNGRREPLRQFDLLKNHLFLRARLNSDDRDKLYKNHWQHFESSEWEEEIGVGKHKKSLSELFLQHFLSYKLANEKVEPLFRTYKKKYLSQKSNITINEELEDIAQHSAIYKDLGINRSATETQKSMELYHVLGITTLRPLFLYLLIEKGLSDSSRERERKHVFDALESYIMRRRLCHPTKGRSYNKFFISMITKLRNTEFTIVQFINLLQEQTTDSLVWPNDDDTKGTVITSIDTHIKRYLLRRVEIFKRSSLTEDIPLPHDMTVEHILPQNWKNKWLLPPPTGKKEVLLKSIISADFLPKNLSDLSENDKKKALKDSNYSESFAIAIERDKLIDNIGNLTLLTRSLNATESDEPFHVKREFMKRYSVSVMNNEIWRKRNWDTKNIKEREKELHKIFCEIWPNADWFLKNIPK